MTLKGKTAVITGASSGLGKTLALDLASRQMNLVLAARNVDALNEVAAQVERCGSTVLVQPTDVTDKAQCRVMTDTTMETFKRIDFLILNAGVSMWARFDEITDMSVFRKLMETNYFGAVNCIYSALPHLRQSHGTIVAISSLQAVLGVPKHTGYSASKHALKGLLEALELEMGDEVHILNVMPGWIRDTNLRANAFKGDGTRIGSAPKHGKQSVSLEECSAKIVRAMQDRRREVYIPSKLSFLPWLRLIAPNRLKVMIKREVDKQEG
ncbi:MAG: SDR family oxidoreductase [Acidobacteriota bacterium]